MAFREADKSTPKPFSDKKPDNFIEERPFHDSDLENQVWDDISKLGGKQIAREEIDLIYRAFADKLESISAEIESLKSSSSTDSKNSIDSINDLVKSSEELVDNEKEESDKIDSSISSLVDLKDITKVDDNLDKRPTDLDEKLLSKIYEKILKSISSPSILVPFITKISEKIYDNITQSSTKIFHDLNKEFKNQLSADVLGDLKDISKAKDLKLIGDNKSDEEAVKRLAAEEKRRREKEKKEQEKKSEENSKKDEGQKSKPKQTTEILEEAAKKREDKKADNQQQSNEEQMVKKSFTSVREALLATADSLNASNQKIKNIWDETLKMNDLEEYSITSGENDDKKEKKDGKKKEQEKNSEEDEKTNLNLNLGKFALIGALAACYFLFKYQASQSHIQKYMEMHPPISKIERDMTDTINAGMSDLERGTQRELEKNSEQEQRTPEQKESENTSEDRNLSSTISDPEIDKKTEEFGNTAIKSSVDEYETVTNDNDRETAKLIEKFAFDSSKESQERLEKFLEDNRLKNTAVEKEIEKRKKEAQEAGEEFQLEIEKIQKQTKRAEKEVRDFTREEEKRRVHDKNITDAASGLVMTETDIIVRQHDEIKNHIRIEEQMVENSKKKEQLTSKAIYEHIEETEEGVQEYQRNLEEQLKQDPETLERIAKIKKRSLQEIEYSGIEVNEIIKDEFSKIHNELVKSRNGDENGVIEAFTDDSKYVIIEMSAYQAMLNNILGIGTRTLEFDNQITAKIGYTPQR